jgi:hypothetical protein
MHELQVHTIAGVHRFSKNPEAISKTCQKSDIKKVHNLKFRHWVRKYLLYVRFVLLLPFITVSFVCLSLHSQLCSCEGQIFV